jgi:DNA-directed RNA polymerase specialized sigma24 family protein
MADLLDDVRNRARQQILAHGQQSRSEQASAWAAFAAAVEGALHGGSRDRNHLAALLLPILRAASLAELRARGLHLQRARHLAQDIANDVYVELLKNNARVLRAWRRSATRHDPRAYFRIIARRRAIDALRRDQRTVHRDPDEFARDLPPPTAAPLSAETAVMVQECLHRTVGRSRDAEAAQIMIYDTLIADARQAEIAEDHGISADALYQRTSRFRREFAAVWSQE